MKYYLIAFSFAFGVTFLLTPLVRRLVEKARALDEPEERKVHDRAVPTLGGCAIYAGVISGIFLYLAIAGKKPGTDFLGIIIGATVILVFGIFDDIRPLSPLVKLFGQVCAAGIPIIMGVQIQSAYIPGFSLVSFSLEISVIVSLIWIVAFMNIINLIDGLDGLAAGITCITAGFIFYYSTKLGVAGGFTDAAIISIALAGATLAFLRYNFNPASIFMGDSGSMLLGFLLGTATIQGMLKTVVATAVAIPLIALAVPIFDTSAAIIRRIFRGRAITHADKEHIHHRLLSIGHSHRGAVLILYFWTALLCGVSLTVRFMVSSVALWAGIVVALMAGFVITAYPRLFRSFENRKNGAGERAETEDGDNLE